MAPRTGQQARQEQAEGQAAKVAEEEAKVEAQRMPPLQVTVENDDGTTTVYVWDREEATSRQGLDFWRATSVELEEFLRELGRQIGQVIDGDRVIFSPWITAAFVWLAKSQAGERADYVALLDEFTLENAGRSFVTPAERSPKA